MASEKAHQCSSSSTRQTAFPAVRGGQVFLTDFLPLQPLFFVAAALTLSKSTYRSYTLFCRGLLKSASLMSADVVPLELPSTTFQTHEASDAALAASLQAAFGPPPKRRCSLTPRGAYADGDEADDHRTKRARPAAAAEADAPPQDGPPHPPPAVVRPPFVLPLQPGALCWTRVPGAPVLWPGRVCVARRCAALRPAVPRSRVACFLPPRSFLPSFLSHSHSVGC